MGDKAEPHGQDPVATGPQTPPAEIGDSAAPQAFRWRVLVVDDSRVQRKILSLSLTRWGYEVIEADSGIAALAACARLPVDVVLSDWMMPGMTGLEFCRAFRGMSRESYGYFILLTSKSEKDEIALGLDAGADDFLTKPVDPHELRARITAGERVLRMERELKAKNRLLTTTLTEVRTLYDTLNRDLIEARKLQQSLVRDRFRSFGNAQVSLLLRPSGHVGGDLVGYFPINAERIGLFAIDVSGHGVTSALMTARLAGFLSGSSAEHNIALTTGAGGTREGRPPAQVAAHLNRMMLQEIETDHYFTLLYADVNLASGRVAMVQAGHPHPAIQRVGGKVEYPGSGGLPIGLIADAQYSNIHLRLSPGDRLFVMSDGITECPDPTGTELGEAGLKQIIKRHRALRGSAFLEAMVWDLEEHADSGEFRDDVSAVLFEYDGPMAVTA